MTSEYRVYCNDEYIACSYLGNRWSVGDIMPILMYGNTPDEYRVLKIDHDKKRIYVKPKEMGKQ